MIPDAKTAQPCWPLASLADDESDLSPIARRGRSRVALPGTAILLRATLAFLIFATVAALVIPVMAAPVPASIVARQDAMLLRLRGEAPAPPDVATNLAAPAPQRTPIPRLRGDVTARGDVLTLSDLVEDAPAALAGRALFRSPALGATGTIQTSRIVEAASALGLQGLETGGRMQIAVLRAARRVGAPEIETALKRGLEVGYGLDPRSVLIRLDGDAPVLLAPADLNGQAAALDLTYDPRSHRVTGLVSLGERQASLRVSGVVIEMREVAVLNRALNRGDTLKEGDVTLEQRPREAAAQDVQGSGTAPIGEVAQRTLPTGTVLRVGDTAPPELVARGEAVTIVYEAPGITLSMRGLANDAGRMGAVVNVVNVASKKVLQATVIGPSRVSVGPGPGQGAQGPSVRATASLR